MLFQDSHPWVLIKDTQLQHPVLILDPRGCWSLAEVLALLGAIQAHAFNYAVGDTELRTFLSKFGSINYTSIHCILI